jgi:hypothetical protein
VTLHGDGPSPSESQLGDDDEAAGQEHAAGFLRAGRAEAELVAKLSSALRVSRLHSLDNVAAREVMDELRDGLQRFLATRERALILVGEARRVYVNGRMVRAGKTGGEWLEELADLLERLGAGGLLLAGGWDVAAARELIASFGTTAGAAAPAERFEALRVALEKLPSPAFAQPLDAAAALAVAKEEEEGYLSESQRASFYFARLVALAEAAHVAVRARRSPDVMSRHLRQTLMKIVDAFNHPLFEARLLGCGVLEPAGVDPLAVHAARVAVLSIAVGRLLGLSRGNVGDLGFGALFHDLGRVDLPRKARSDGQGEDHSSLENHVLEAVRYSLRGRTYATSGLLRLVVGFEHHRVKDGVPDAVLRESHAFSNIVAVVDAFDRLEHGQPWRKAICPAEALQELAGDPERYDPAVVELLMDVLGRAPRGSVLQLRTGEIVVVVDGGARRGHRPVVRRLMLASGTPDPEGTLAVLESMEAVVAELDPEVAFDWRTAVIS